MLKHAPPLEYAKGAPEPRLCVKKAKVRSNISNTRDSVSSHFQTLKR